MIANVRPCPAGPCPAGPCPAAPCLMPFSPWMDVIAGSTTRCRW
jgi:hypothetical protein